MRVNFEVNSECPVDFMCTEEEVYNLLISLDTTKANGSDRISAKMLKETAMHQHHPFIDKTIQYFDIIWKIPCEVETLFHCSHS